MADETDLFGLISNMFGPNAANAAGAPLLPTDRIAQGFSAAGPGGGEPFQAGPGVAPPPTDGTGNVPPPPNNIVTMNPPPAVPLPQARPDNLGAVLAGNEPVPGAQGPTSLGGESGPAPLAAPATSTDISAQSKPAARPSLAEALKGTAGIKPPEVQKISSPNAPRATGTIKSGDLQALLMALNAGGAAPARPVRLGG